MPIDDKGNTETTVTNEESMAEQFGYGDETEESTEETVEISQDLLNEVADKLGLVEDEANSLGEERLMMLLRKVEPAEEVKETPKPKAKRATNVKSLKMDDDFDPRLVTEMEYDRAQIKAMAARIDELTSARETDVIDDLRGSLAEAASKAGISKEDAKRAEEVVIALKSGYGDTVPDNDELIQMAIRSIAGSPTGSNRSDQFLSRPTHRNTKGGSSKETPTERAVRNLKVKMDQMDI